MTAQRMGGVKWKYIAEQFLYYTRSSVILLLLWLSNEESVCLSMQEAQVQSLGRKDLLEKEMAAHSSVLAWEIPWTGYTQSMGSQRVGHDLVTKQQQQSIILLESKAW